MTSEELRKIAVAPIGTPMDRATTLFDLGPSRGPSPALRAMVDRIKADVLRAVSERRYAEDLVVRRMA